MPGPQKPNPGAKVTGLQDFPNPGGIKKAEKLPVFLFYGVVSACSSGFLMVFAHLC
jgi:hypothetical protein